MVQVVNTNALVEQTHVGGGHLRHPHRHRVLLSCCVDCHSRATLNLRARRGVSVKSAFYCMAAQLLSLFKTRASDFTAYL